MKTHLFLSMILLALLLPGCVDGTKTEMEADGATDKGVNTVQQRPQGSALQPVPEEIMMEDAAIPRAKMIAGSSGFIATRAETPMLSIAPQPEWNTESYNSVSENGYIAAGNDPLSTFSIDVDTASYANVRRFVQGGSLPPVGAVRIEEMVNYFSYDYPRPQGDHPLSITAEAGPSPYNEGYQLVRIGLRGKPLDTSSLPPSNLVFLVDVSGSMNSSKKLPLLKESMKMLVNQLKEDDRVAIVTYAGFDRVVLQPTPVQEKAKIIEAIEQMNSGGSTHGSKGIMTAYELAARSLIPGGNNRVILASDGDFNVGITSRGELAKLIEEKRNGGVYLTVLGFGMGNLHDDTMELLADKGNGNYAYIDSLLEAKKVLVKEMGGTLFTIAGDVKIQVEFNPAVVGAYRLIGYENRMLADEDFKDDKKDAGEIGADHRVTALYELIPAGHPDVPVLDELKYSKVRPSGKGDGEELLTVKVRYKKSGQQTSVEISKVVTKGSSSLAKTSDDFRFAASVAGYGMLLKGSQYNNALSWQGCLDLARGAKGKDVEGYRAEFQHLVELSQLLEQNK